MDFTLGWRKLTAWGLIFALCSAVAIKAVFAGQANDLPAGVIDLIKWVTGFFFGANVLEHLSSKVTLTNG